MSPPIIISTEDVTVITKDGATFTRHHDGTITTTSSRGGARKGSGRKRLDVTQKRVSRSIGLRQEQWERLDELRGDLSRGDFVAGLLGARKP